MKKFIVIFLLVFLVMFTAFIKNSTKRIDDQIYILSFHEPTSQIWLSSPISGAHHFELKDKKNFKSWFSTRDIKLNLYDLIHNEINKSNDS